MSKNQSLTIAMADNEKLAAAVCILADAYARIDALGVHWLQVKVLQRSTSIQRICACLNCQEPVSAEQTVDHVFRSYPHLLNGSAIPK